MKYTMGIHKGDRMTNILIIEDDREINRLIESTLISEGYSCDCAFDGKEGADRIEEKT